MKMIIPIVAFLFSVSSYGQTKLISFRSHSGNNANFRTTVENNLFDIGNSNFGIIVKLSKVIDTVMLVSNNRIIIVRKIYHDGDDHPVFSREILSSANAGEFFTANSIDSLKVAIHEKYKGVILDSTRFIGFDKKFERRKKSYLK
jgi:hypothetical protein